MHFLFYFSALRELLKTKIGNHPCSECSSGELTKEIGLPQSEKENVKAEVQQLEDKRHIDDSTEVEISPTRCTSLGGSFLQLNDAADEFFDVPEQSEYDLSETSWSSDSGNEMQSQVLCRQILWYFARLVIFTFNSDFKLKTHNRQILWYFACLDIFTFNSDFKLNTHTQRN